MTNARLITSVALAAVVVTGLAAPRPASALVATCRKSLAKEIQKFTGLKSKALQSCEDKRTSGSLPPGTVCRTEAGTALSIAKASNKARNAMVKSCCGPDRTCGNTDDEPTVLLGWGGPTCPNFENGQTGSCDNAIDDPGDVADCLLCIASGATDQLIDLLYRSLATSSDGTVKRCQRAIGKATAKFFQAKSRILATCWQKRISGTHDNDCPTPGDGKAASAIANAETKKIRSICKACGGDDGLCDGVGDLTPATIGFPANCPSVEVPDDGGPHGGDACGGPVTTLAELVACVDCVAEFKVDCVDDLTVREYESYDSACNLGATPAATSTPGPTGGTPTPTSTPTPAPTFTPNPNCGNGVVDPGEACDPRAPAAGQPCHPSVCVPNGLPAGGGAEYACTCATGSERTVYAEGQLDNGWTGTSQGTRTVDHTVVDLLLFGCDGGSDPECLVYGPRPGPYGFRCELNARMACTTDADCGGNGRCGQFLGPPLPLSSGGIPVCVTSFFDRPVSGTLNVSSGTTASRAYLKAIVHLAQAVDAPCALCNCTAPLCLNQVGDAGICSGGPAVGQACTIEGVSDFGPVSLDCPPLSSTNISGSGLDVRFLPTTTGTSALDVSVPCTDPAAAGYLCPCDTCGGGPTPNAPCHTDADCGAGGVCGAKRCTSGGNAGQICTTDANCPPGTPGSCGRPGLATKPNACSMGCNGGANNNQACSSNADCPSGACVPLCRQNGGQEIGQGSCMLGPSDGHCSLEPFRGCTADLQCAPPPLGTCLGCQLGQTCMFQNRPCHVFPIQLQGQAGAFVAGSSTGESVNSFCIPPTSSDAVNQTSGIPGEGVILVPHTLTVQFPAAPQ